MQRHLSRTAVLLAGIVSCAGFAARASAPGIPGKDARLTHSEDDGRLTAARGISVDAPHGISDPEQAAAWFLNKYGALFGLDAPGLKTECTETHHHLGQNIVRFSLTLDGLPVFSRRAVVQVDSESRIRRVMARFPAVAPARSPHPLLTQAEKEDWAARYGYPVHAVVAEGWLISNDGEVRPVVEVDTLTMSIEDPLTLFIDASTGRILQSEPIEWTHAPLGAVFPENPITTPDVEIVPIEYLDDRTDRLNGAYARVATCIDKEQCEETAPLALLSSENNWQFIYEPMLDEYTFDDPFAEVNVYHNVSAVNAWMRRNFGWSGLFGDHEWIEAKVGRAWYNAAYYGGNEDRDPFLMFGQDIVDFAYDSDAAYHEFGHAMNRTLWEHPWAVVDEFGFDISLYGIEEAFADIWAEHFAGDPILNSYIVGSRTADNTYTCPEDLMAEGHYEARILSGFAWDVREEIGAEAWGHIAFRTLNFMEPEMRFDGFVSALADSAEDLLDEGNAGVEPEHVETILRLGEERGLRDEECLNRMVPMIEGRARRVYGYGSRRTGKLHYPFGLQWKIEVPAGAEALVLYFAWLYPTEEDVEGVKPGYNVHLRRGAPVEIEWLDFNSLEEGDRAFEATEDFSATGAPVSVSYPYLGLAPLHEDEVVYVLLSSDTEESIVVIDSIAFFIPELPLPPVDPDDEQTDSGPETQQELFTVADNFNCNTVISHKEMTFSGFALAIFRILLDY